MYIDVILRNRGKFSDMLFTYKVPSFLEKDIEMGHRISVPFGNSNKPIEAIVVEKKNDIMADDISKIKIKEIIDIIDEKPLLNRDSIEMLLWIRNRYMCTYNDALNLFYPKGYSYTSRKIISPVKSISELTIDEESSLSNKERKILNEVYLNNDELQYDVAVENFSNYSIMKLKEKGLLKISWVYKESKNEKFVKYLYLEKSVDFIKDFIDNNKKIGPKQREVLEFLIQNDGTDFQTISELLEVTNVTIKSLENKGLIKIDEESIFRKNKSIYVTQQSEVVLNDEQKNIYNSIKQGIEDGNSKPYLIYGVTGSGKTEVYLELINYVLNQGMDSIFLVPEIALTPQTIARVKNKFGNIVGVYHSQLSEGEKHDIFREIKNGNIRVVIGTRSAIFLPFDTLGLVIIDEEHDSSYKSEKTPKYDTIEIARYMAFKRNTTVILGSATPSVADYKLALDGEYKLLKLLNRANSMNMPEIEVVDMREELHRGNPSPISKKLLSEISKTLHEKNQVILFLNKRGYANVMTCKDCGKVFKCKNCDISLTNHKHDGKGICHYCGYEEKIPDVCPGCGGNHISNIGIGTEKVEEIISNYFPNNKVIRLDKDTTKKKGKLESILSKFNKGDADILVGTQMLSKGHDFENVTLVGIISADMMLNYPDYKSFETTFQLITQVSGRAGRSEKEGKVILQTYNTENFAITNAVNHDYIGFYNEEINLRKAFGYEPFNNILRIVFSGKNLNMVKNNAFKFSETIKYLMDEKNYSIDKNILGPNECSIRMIKDKYRWQIIIKDYGIDIKYLKSMVKFICITKYNDIFDKEVEINIELNPNSFI